MIFGPASWNRRQCDCMPEPTRLQSFWARFGREESLADAVQEIRVMAGERFCTDRLFEWVASGIMLLITVTLSLPGETLERSALTPLLRAGITEEGLAAFFGVCGTLRAIALFSNGRLRRSGSRMRAFGSVAGAVVWAELALVLFLDSLLTGKPSFVLPIFLGLIGGELISSYRSIFDVGRQYARSGVV